VLSAFQYFSLSAFAWTVSAFDWPLSAFQCFSFSAFALVSMSAFQYLSILARFENLRHLRHAS
jgi:hypothetical protein